MRALALARREAPERYSPRVCLLIIAVLSAAAWAPVVALVWGVVG